MGAQRIYSNTQAIGRGVVKMYSKVVLGSSGAISSQTSAKKSGMVVTKTGSKTGRYTVVLDRAYPELLNCSVMIQGTDDAALTDAKGAIPRIRNVTVSTDGTFYIQFIKNTDSSDAEVQDSATLYIEVTVRDAVIN